MSPSNSERERADRPPPRFTNFSFNRLLGGRHQGSGGIRSTATVAPTIPTSPSTDALTPSDPTPAPVLDEKLSLPDILHLLAHPEHDTPTLLAYTRLATTQFPGASPVPQPDVVTPALLRVCAASSPTELRSAGFELMAAYITVTSNVISSINRSAFWYIIKDAGPGLAGSAEEWQSRSSVLTSLTDNGNEVDGMQGLITWLSGLARRAASCRLPSSMSSSTSEEYRPVDAEADGCLNWCLTLLTDVLRHNAQAMSAFDISLLVDTFDGIVTDTLVGSDVQGGNWDSNRFSGPTLASPTAQTSLGASQSTTSLQLSRSHSNLRPGNNQPPPAVPRPPLHRRNPSSSSSTLLRTNEASAFTASSSTPQSTKHILPALLYADFATQLLATSVIPHTSLHKLVATMMLLLSRGIEVLPALNVKKPTPAFRGAASWGALPPYTQLNSIADAKSLNVRVEAAIWEVMRSLLSSSAYSISTARTLKKLLLNHPVSPSPTATVVPLLPFPDDRGFSAYLRARYAEGAARTMRLALRRAAEGRLARHWLSNQSSSYAPTGVPTFLTHQSTMHHIPGVSGDNGFDDDSGASTPDVNEMLQRAWGKEGEGGAWEVERVSTVLPEAARIWVGLLDGNYVAGDEGKRAREGDWERERVVRECLGVVNDLIEECVRTDDRNSMSSLGVVEGRLVGEVMHEAVKCVEKYQLQEPYMIDLEHPYSEHPTPLLRTLCYVLSRIPPCQPQFLGLNTGGLSTQRFLPPSIVPSLASSLLSVAPHVQDESLARLLKCYLLEGSLTPSAPNWLGTLQTLFDAVGLGDIPEAASSDSKPRIPRTQARKALGEVVTAVYQEARDHRPHRVALLSMCLAVWERSYAEDEGIEIIDGVWTVIADGIVAGAADEDPRQYRQKDTSSVSGLDQSTGSVENGQLELRLRRLVCRVARDAVCPSERPGRRPDPVKPGLATVSASGPQSPTTSPIRSISVISPTPTRPNPTNEQSMAPFRSLLTALASPVHGQSLKSQQETRTSASETPEDVSTEELPNSTEPSVALHVGCRSLSAVLSLIDAFHSLAFAPPHSLSSASAYSRTARAPASHRCIDVFRDMLALLTPGTATPLSDDDLQWHERATKESSPTGVGQASCPRARLAILQWLVRLRAHRDHRLYIMKDLDVQLEPLATIIGRGGSSQGQDENAPSPPSDEREGGVRRNRSLTRRGAPVIPDPQRRGRDQVTTAEFGRARALSRDQRPTASRSPSQPPGAAPREEPIWRVPEVLPFEVHVGTRPSEGMTTYEAGMASADAATTSLWLPTSAYVCCLLDVVRDEQNPEILSYALCHLPLQLANKHFFCGPMTAKVLVPFTGVVLSAIQSNHLSSRFSKTRYPEILSLSYHVLSVLVSYKRLFNRPILEAFVEAFQLGLNRYPVTVKPCLLGLTLAAFELQSQITRSLSKILSQLSLIVTNPAVSVHILEFLIILGNIPALYANFTEEDYKRVFTVALRYIQHHNHASSPSSHARSHALSQHLRAIAYYTIYVWFSAVKLPERPKYVPHITRSLLIANERKGVVEVDEPTEVCFDWLARAAYGNADPKPTRSFLGDVLTGSDEDATVSQKTWLQGNAVITIKSLKRPGWVELECRRPSGMTRFHCRLENIRLGSLLDDVEDFSEAGLQTPKVSTAGSLVDLHSIVGESSSSSSDSSVKEGSGEVTGDSMALATSSQSLAPAPDRNREVLIDPSFLPLQASPYPDSRKSPRSTMVPPTEEFKRTLRNLDRIPVIDSHTIGVLYVAPGQTTEEEILGNRHGSPAYTRFLHGLGRLVHLKNQKDVYTGGLDTYADEDGKYTYAWWNDIIQVLYHITTLMPNRHYDRQYAHKKKHVGNDYVRIVWNDSGAPYRFDTLKTEFQFANVVIEPHSAGVIGAYTNALHDHEYFKVSCQRAAGMPEFGPVGEFKVVSAESLPAYVREVSLLADFFAPVWVHTHRDTRKAEYVSNWRSRLQTINRLRAALAAASQPTEDLNEGSAADLAAQEKARDFTRIY